MSAIAVFQRKGPLNRSRSRCTVGTHVTLGKRKLNSNKDYKNSLCNIFLLDHREVAGGWCLLNAQRVFPRVCVCACVLFIYPSVWKLCKLFSLPLCRAVSQTQRGRMNPILLLLSPSSASASHPLPTSYLLSAPCCFALCSNFHQVKLKRAKADKTWAWKKGAGLRVVVVGVFFLFFLLSHEPQRWL